MSKEEKIRILEELRSKNNKKHNAIKNTKIGLHRVCAVHSEILKEYNNGNR